MFLGSLERSGFCRGFNSSKMAEGAGCWTGGHGLLHSRGPEAKGPQAALSDGDACPMGLLIH